MKTLLLHRIKILSSALLLAISLCFAGCVVGPKVSTAFGAGPSPSLQGSRRLEIR